MTILNEVWNALSVADKAAIAACAAGFAVWCLQHSWAHSAIPLLWPDSTLLEKGLATAFLSVIGALVAGKLSGTGALAAFLPVLTAGLASHLIAGQGVCGGGAAPLVQAPTGGSTIVPPAVPTPQPPPTVTPVVFPPVGWVPAEQVTPPTLSGTANTSQPRTPGGQFAPKSPPAP